ncbi:PfkB family carbohydrate kinase [Kibdelosporangium persicum]|uniref:Bifunctional ribokinase/ribose-5-phosphate isomerase A n=1 Tax=Kibdelosporangium persicum TaxID=2698649 RepID=A0ABX2EW47_9PSEU|nr:PfkB family carbohydrate kinase [Kibdelosporangium persicum]NRN63183.1 Bifunctional ribokinase/ribose-5-phosphate isomerase A [Kibdelosporangium persicum]
MNVCETVVLGQVARDLVLVVPQVPDAGSTAPVHRRREMLGGKGANIAVAATQLGSTVALVGVVGADDTSDWLIAQAHADGIDTRHVIRRQGTPAALIVDLVTPDAQWRYLEDIPEAVMVTEADVTAAQSTLAAARSVIIQLQQPTGTALAAARYARDARIVLDGVPESDELLACADVLRADQQEGELLTGAELDTADKAVRAGRDLLRRGPSVVALATAEANVFVWQDGHAVFPLGDTEVKDTTGGGDALVAALTVGLTHGLDPHDAGKMAVTASARTVDHPGGRPDLRREEVWPR